MSSYVGSDDDEVFVLPADCRLEPCLLEPAELVGQRARLVVGRPDRRDRVLRILRDNDVGQYEAPARTQLGVDATEQVRFRGVVEVMNGQRGDDEVDPALGCAASVGEPYPDQPIFH
jgi:hypothetical protein